MSYQFISLKCSTFSANLTSFSLGLVLSAFVCLISASARHKGKIPSRSVIHSTLYSCKEFGESGEFDDFGEPSDSGESDESVDSGESGDFGDSGDQQHQRISASATSHQQHQRISSNTLQQHQRIYSNSSFSSINA